jgi:hypothetical protein
MSFTFRDIKKVLFKNVQKNHFFFLHIQEQNEELKAIAAKEVEHHML